MGWSEKYKKSINCNNPKGFSQKAHCASKKIKKENMKLSELKNIIKDLIQERSINAISKAREKNAARLKDTLELYKKAKGGNDAYKKKNIIKVLYKLNDEKKKLEKEMDDKISSLYKNADYKGPIDEGSINEGPSREEFRIAAMAIRKQAKFRNVSPEQAIQDQLNALKLLQRYIKKGDVKKYTGMNLSESKIELGKVYDNPYHTAFKSPEQIIKEADDHEVGMGLSSLKSSVRSAKVIYDNIKKRNIEELDGWVQEKLTLASDYLKNVADYMEDLDEYDKDGTNN